MMRVTLRLGCRYDVRLHRGHLDWNEAYTLHLSLTFFGTTDLCTGFLDGTLLAKAACARTYWDPREGIRREEIRLELEGEKVDGTLFIPATPGPHPALIDLFGGIGRKVELRAALWARHGFRALALSYANSPAIDKVVHPVLEPGSFMRAGFAAHHVRLHKRLLRQDRGLALQPPRDLSKGRRHRLGR